MKGRKEVTTSFNTWFKDCESNVRSSMIIMGLGQWRYGQKIKGSLYFLILIGLIAFFTFTGVEAIGGFFTLGTERGDAWRGIEGDNSIVMLLMGILTCIILAFFIFC